MKKVVRLPRKTDGAKSPPDVIEEVNAYVREHNSLPARFAEDPSELRGCTGLNPEAQALLSR